MKVKKSFKEDGAKLYIVPTPIGNLEDITFRALSILKKVDYIAAEDTRNTRKLLNHFEINKPLISYHEHNKRERTGKVIKDLVEEGKAIALVSDAGMPAISDPGTDLVQEAIKENIDVVVLPGANAALTALVGSGLKTDQFLFYGFLPRKNKEITEVLEKLEQLPATLIFYESPYRIKQTLQKVYEQLGNRRVAIARELTKRFEEYIRGPIKEVIAWTKEKDIKGEVCLIVEGGSGKTSEEELWWTAVDVRDHVEYDVGREDRPRKEAIKKVATERRMTRKEVYSSYHIE